MRGRELFGSHMDFRSSPCSISPPIKVVSNSSWTLDICKAQIVWQGLIDSKLRQRPLRMEKGLLRFGKMQKGGKPRLAYDGWKPRLAYDGWKPWLAYDGWKPWLAYDGWKPWIAFRWLVRGWKPLIGLLDDGEVECAGSAGREGLINIAGLIRWVTARV